MAMAISVAVVEDDAETLARFARVIAAEPSLRFVFGATGVAALLEWFADHPVDVLLVDLGLPDGSGIDLMARCRALQPACAMMVITVFADETHMLGAFEAGACGYLLKDGTEADLAMHVRHLHKGGSPMSPLIARRLLRRWTARELPPPSSSLRDAPGGMLSPREAEILGLVAKGFSYQEIAGQLGVSITTIQSHVRGIYRKLAVHNRTEAVFEARQLGLLR